MFERTTGINSDDAHGERLCDVSADTFETEKTKTATSRLGCRLYIETFSCMLSTFNFGTRVHPESVPHYRGDVTREKF